MSIRPLYHRHPHTVFVNENRCSPLFAEGKDPNAVRQGIFFDNSVGPQVLGIPAGPPASFIGSAGIGVRISNPTAISNAKLVLTVNQVTPGPHNVSLVLRESASLTGNILHTTPVQSHTGAGEKTLTFDLPDLSVETYLIQLTSPEFHYLRYDNAAGDSPRVGIVNVLGTDENDIVLSLHGDAT